jgi:hypothetical protein
MSEAARPGEAMGRQLGRVHRKGNREEKERELGRLEIQPKRLLGLNKVFSIFDITLGLNQTQIQFEFEWSPTRILKLKHSVNSKESAGGVKCNKQLYRA